MGIYFELSNRPRDNRASKDSNMLEAKAQMPSRGKLKASSKAHQHSLKFPKAPIGLDLKGLYDSWALLNDVGR